MCTYYSVLVHKKMCKILVAPVVIETVKNKDVCMRTALEITNAFGEISPEDPIKYEYINPPESFNFRLG